ncbi:MAG: thioredoxin [Lentisphaerae bacterium]|nr:thioredoxin [Lentisphaerota bacterium]
MHNTTPELNDINFKAETSDGVVLVDFWAPWCSPCRIQEPIVQSVGQKTNGSVRVAKLNVEAAPETAAQFKIRSIPTLIVFKNGVPIEKLTGLHTEDQLIAAVHAALN